VVRDEGMLVIHSTAAGSCVYQFWGLDLSQLTVLEAPSFRLPSIDLTEPLANMEFYRGDLPFIHRLPRTDSQSSRDGSPLGFTPQILYERIYIR
jgi:hypothetical protein